MGLSEFPPELILHIANTDFHRTVGKALYDLCASVDKLGQLALLFAVEHKLESTLDKLNDPKVRFDGYVALCTLQQVWDVWIWSSNCWGYVERRPTMHRGGLTAVDRAARKEHLEVVRLLAPILILQSSSAVHDGLVSDGFETQEHYLSEGVLSRPQTCRVKVCPTPTLENAIGRPPTSPVYGNGNNGLAALKFDAQASLKSQSKRSLHAHHPVSERRPIDKFRSTVNKIMAMKRSTTILAAIGAGAEPGIDPRRASMEMQYRTLKKDCVIEVVDYSAVSSSFLNMRNAEFVEWCASSKSKRQPWVKVRWINITGVSWDVIKALSLKHELHPLALEDVLHTRPDNLSKADYFLHHLFLRVLIHDVEDGSSPIYMLEAEGLDPSAPASDEALRERQIEQAKLDALKQGTLRVSRLADVCFPLPRWYWQFFSSSRPLLIVATGTVITIIQHASPDLMLPISDRLRRADTILRSSADPSMLVQSLLGLIVDKAVQVIDAYHDQISRIEGQILRNPKPSTVRKLHIVSGDMVLHKRTLEPIKTLVYGLRRYDTDRCAALVDDSDPEFNGSPLSGGGADSLAQADVYDHTEYILSTLDMIAGIGESLTDYSFNMASYSMNDTMRLLTMITIICLPLTFVSGYFGMNFDDQPWTTEHTDVLFWIIALPAVAVISPLFIIPDIKRMWHYIQTRKLLKTPNASLISRCVYQTIAINPTMPAYRRTKFTCAYAEPTPRPSRPSRSQEAPEGHDPRGTRRRGYKKLVNKSKRELKKEWEATLVPATQSPTFYWPAGTRGLYPSDAKRVYKLTPKEMDTLKREHIQNSPKSIVRLSDVLDLAKRKHEKLEMGLPPFVDPVVGYGCILVIDEHRELDSLLQTSVSRDLAYNMRIPLIRLLTVLHNLTVPAICIRRGIQGDAAMDTYWQEKSLDVHSEARFASEVGAILSEFLDRAKAATSSGVENLSHRQGSVPPLILLISFLSDPGGLVLDSQSFPATHLSCPAGQFPDNRSQNIPEVPFIEIHPQYPELVPDLASINALSQANTAFHRTVNKALYDLCASVDKLGQVALLFAIEHKLESTLDKLNDAKIRFDGEFDLDSRSCGPLYIAASMGCLGIVVKLLGICGEETVHRRTGGLTALDHAARKGHLEIVRLLASIPIPQSSSAVHDGLVSDEFETQEHYLSEGFLSSVLAGNLEVSQYLIGEGAAVNFAPSNRVTTPLYYATSTGNLELVQSYSPRVLTQTYAPNTESLPCANIHAKGRESQNVLPLVVDKSVEMLRFFLEHGVDPNHEDVFGWTPLHYACQRNVTAPVELLLQFGAATVEKADGAGRTPVDHAMRTASLKVVKVLQPLVQNPDLEAKIARWWKENKGGNDGL
ncbi:hypothetical protein B0H14DRAFT_2589193 [Mycena olivaceomarginata]|nr:hypothetical protein B0H14DRAFT_2589193 [Mycena olivaceomarginata]